MKLDIFLQKSKSKKSVNTSSGINMALKGKRKLLPMNDIAETVSQYEQYLDERDKCNIIRLTCQVNPICSNVLHNYVTEILQNEGSSGVSFLNYNVNITDDMFEFAKPKDHYTPYWNKMEKATRDTQLSKEFVYHCGRDIFNNHLIRSKTFKTICNLPSTTSQRTEIENYNTIRDLMRDDCNEHAKGQQVKETICYPLEANVDTNSKTIDLHVYEVDDVFSYEECIDNRLLRTYNGWLGFENRAKMKTYDWKLKDAVELPIDRPIMYMNGGDFVDMYPDRSLYSFVPKFNKFKKRIEKNWNYCITYPSSSTTRDFGTIINYDTNGLQCLVDESTRSDNGASQLVVYSISKHGLSKGDFVNIYKTVRNGITRTSTKVIDNAKVNEVIDDFIFTIFSNTVIFNEDEEQSNIEVSYKKVVSDIECDYYVRIFSRLPNFKFASADTSNEYEIYKNNGELINIYQDKEYEFENHVSRLAFAKNIYSDEIGQVVFTDDIDISKLKDNLGRPLSTIYFTAIKNNQGYKQWYGFNYNPLKTWSTSEIEKDSIEYSHCFGKISCGLETNGDLPLLDDDASSTLKADIAKISINQINNIDSNLGLKVDNINARPYGRDYAITSNEVAYDVDKHFYGDLCYYDNYNATESIIQPILQRFNTAQRESKNSKSNKYFSGFTYDVFSSDDYDVNTFNIGESTFTNVNEMREGYYYNPHYEIPIKSLSELRTAMPQFLDILKLEKTPDNKHLTITCLQNHFLSIGDKAILFDKNANVYYMCITISGDSDNYKTFTCDVYDEDGNEDMLSNITSTSKDYKLFKIDNLDIPSYARLLKDGTCRIIWRDIINNGMNGANGVEEYPFTNGAFYINKRIDIYVRRQDPNNIWGLYNGNDIEGKTMSITKEDYFVKEDEIVC